MMERIDDVSFDGLDWDEKIHGYKPSISINEWPLYHSDYYLECGFCSESLVDSISRGESNVFTFRELEKTIAEHKDKCTFAKYEQVRDINHYMKEEIIPERKVERVMWFRKRID